MKLQMAIKTRMMVSILAATIVSFSTATFFCSTKSKRLISEKSRIIIEIQSKDNAKAITEKLEDLFAPLDSLAPIQASFYEDYDDELNYKIDFSNKGASQKSKMLVNFRTDWEISRSEFKDVSDVYIDKLDGKNESAFMCKLARPILLDGDFIGEVSANIIIDSLLTDFKNPFGHNDQMKILLISDKGTIMYSKNNAERTRSASQVMPHYYEKYELQKFINNDTLTIVETDGKDVEASIFSIHPIKITDDTKWSLCVVIPKRCIIGEAKNLIIMVVLLVILCTIVIGGVTLLLSNKIGGSLSKISIVLDKVSKGELKTDEKLPQTTLKEINDISVSTSTVISGLTKASEFAEQIGAGNLNAKFVLLGENDKLGNALMTMRDNLQKADEDAEKRKLADEKVNWATLGLAKFGEILHTNNQNINDLSYEILHNLIKYINVNQGAIYILDDTQDEPEYEMTAAIAYDRRKFMQKRFAIGQDLVGRCAFERKTIYMTDIPDNYITITSGMGSATATTLLLVPLVLNDNVFGIIELASFQQLEDYKINFVEKLAESIASTISTVKTNERTNNLLNQSKIQAEELASKEEEMRQNMEELQATQEEAARRENESNAIMEVINSKLIVVDYDMDGTITNVNDTYASMLGVANNEIIGQKSDEGVDMTPEQMQNHIKMWSNLRNGQTVTETNHIILNGKDLWIKETYSPVFDQNGNRPYKVTKVGIDITDQIVAQAEIDQMKHEHKNYEDRIAELENMLNGTTMPKKASKATAKKAEPDDENEFNAVVGEQKLIVWDENCEMGIIEIDEQLKKLTDLANSVYTTFRANKPKKEIKDSIRSLIDFAQYHFGIVEGYADDSDFTGKKDIKQSFKNFVAKIGEFQNLYADNKIKSADGLMLYMNKWMNANIELMKKLGECLKK